MTNDRTLEGLKSYVNANPVCVKMLDEDALIDMIQDHLIAWAREEAQANNRNFSTCYEETLVTFISTLEARA